MRYVSHLGSIAGLATLCWICACGASARADAPATGDFEWKLTAHAPASTPAELTKRFGYAAEEISSVPDLTDKRLFVHVPADYAPASPPGVLVVISDRQVTAPPAEIKSICDAMHLICVVPEDGTGDPVGRATLMLDIADNLQKQYTLDKRRVYCVNDSEEDHFSPFVTADAYTGFINSGKFIMYGRVLMPKRHGYFEPHDTHVPSEAIIAQAKRRGWVFATDPELGSNDAWGKEYRRDFAAQMGSKGYSHVQLIDVGSGEAQYPKFDVWLKRAIHFLDASQSATPGTPAASQPATGGAAAASGSADAAARLLKLGKLYFDAGKKDLARAKLKEVLTKYPTDPAAATAKKLLDQLDGSP